MTEKWKRFVEHVDEVDLSTEEHSCRARRCTSDSSPRFATTRDRSGGVRGETVDFVAAARRQRKTDDMLLRVLRETISFEQFAGLLRRVALGGGGAAQSNNLDFISSVISVTMLWQAPEILVCAAIQVE